MEQYRLFFSWQNDNKDTKNLIKESLNESKNALYKEENIELVLDEDTRDRSGNKDIVHEVFAKIEKCDIFLADLTPVVTMYEDTEHKLPKHIPNSNVMFEYGYAMRSKGEGKLITLAKLDTNEYLEYMPFDINHNTITTFKNKNDLKHLTKWIKNIIKEIDKERADMIPNYACDLISIERDFSNQIVIHPKYKKIIYVAPKAQKPKDEKSSNEEIILNPTMHLYDLAQRQRKDTVDSSLIKPLHKETNISFCQVSLCFENKGIYALENCKLTITANSDNVMFSPYNTKESFFNKILTPSSTSVDEKSVYYHIDTLNPQSSSIIDAFYIHAPHDINSFQLIWSLSSKTFQEYGALEVIVKPDYQMEYVENDQKKGTESVNDYIEYK